MRSGIALTATPAPRSSAGGGWLRAKQFSNGTLYLEASDEALLSRMTTLLNGQSPAAPLKTAKATGKPYENDYCWVFEVSNGKIDRLHEYMDSHYTAKLFGMD